MKELFRGYIVVVWKGTNINSDKYKVLNKIVVQKCVEFYVKYQKHRYEIYRNEEKQNNRVKKWYEKEKERTQNSEMQQVREYVKKFKINIERCNIDTIKKWIMNLKIIEKKIEKVSKNDIRRYISV